MGPKNPPAYLINQDLTEASSFVALKTLNTLSSRDVAPMPNSVHCNYMYMANYVD